MFSDSGIHEMALIHFAYYLRFVGGSKKYHGSREGGCVGLYILTDGNSITSGIRFQPLHVNPYGVDWRHHTYDASIFESVVSVTNT